jgi:energy-coupling factor transporter ATP-binding protein EcfA2
MVSLIIGRRGSGKTKRLISLVGEAVEHSQGNVVCVEKDENLRFDVNYRARLIETDLYGIEGYDAFYGLLCGICAGDHDITDILVDATLKIGGRDCQKLAAFLKKADSLSKIAEKRMVFTVSADYDELPAEIFSFCKLLG